MKKLTLRLLLISLSVYACSQKPETPESAAKAFVRTYYFSEDRSDLLKYTSDAAQTKILYENNYIIELKNQKSEIEKPEFFSLIDSIPNNLNVTQYMFSIYFEGQVTRIENMLVMLKRDDNVWKVSDYRFTQAGEK